MRVALEPWEPVALKAQKSVHVTDMDQVLLVARVAAQSLIPLLDHLEDLGLDRGGDRQRPLGELADKFVQEFFGCDLEVERVATVLDTVVEELTYKGGRGFAI